MMKFNPKVYDPINWLKNNLKIHIVWYLEKNIKFDKEKPAKYLTAQEWKELFRDKITSSFILISFIYSLKT